MAKIKAHGTEIGTINYIPYSKKYMSDRVILINRGHGWKVYGKVKPGVEMADYFAQKQEQQQKVLEARPAFAAYRKELIKVPLSKRYWLTQCLELMPDDPDGIWSELNDGYYVKLKMDVDRIAQLCNLYKAVKAEKTEFNDGQ